MSVESDSARRLGSENTWNPGFRTLKAWQVAVDLSLLVYQLTESWPAKEQFGITNQDRRASVSVSLNIAEGRGRLSKAEYKHHLSIAYGSLCEVETAFHIATELSYAPRADEAAVNAKCNECGRLIRGLIKSLP